MFNAAECANALYSICAHLACLQAKGKDAVLIFSQIRMAVRFFYLLPVGVTYFFDTLNLRKKYGKQLDSLQLRESAVKSLVMSPLSITFC